MPTFKYQGRDQRGRLVSGQLEAESQQAAVDQLFEKNIIPLNIKVAKKWFSAKDFEFSIFKASVKTDDLAFFCRQMHAMIRAGVPLLTALKLLVETTHSRTLATSLRGVMTYISSGLSFTESLRRFPNVFVSVFTNLVEAGEKAGQLEQAFLELSGYLTFQSETKKAIISAVRYPLFVIVGMTISLVIIVVYAVPKFASLFASMNTELPLITRIVVGVATFIKSNGLYMLVFLILLIMLYTYLSNTKKGRYYIDKAKLKIPPFGKIVLLIVFSRFTRIFAIVLRSGLPLVDSLHLVANAVGNVFFKTRLDIIAEKVSRGDSLIQSIHNEKMFSPLIKQMMQVGEETGNLDAMLDESAAYYDREVTYHMQRIQELIQPILLVVVGGILLVIVLAVMLPMLKMLTLFSGGA